MAKKISLKLVFETEYRIVGVFCPERDYRFCWLLNNHLKLGFRRTSDFSFFLPKEPAALNFSVFHFAIEHLQQNFYLVNNRSNEGTRLFSTPPGLDYLFVIKADEDRFDMSNLLRQIRSVPQVSAAYLLEDALGKNREAFLYDFEVFVAQELKV